MKKLGIYILAGVLGFSTACTDDFENINTDPNKVTDLDPGFQFGTVQLKYAGDGHEEWRGNLIMSGPISGVQAGGYRTGQSFQTSDSYAEAKWSALYKTCIKNGMDMLSNMSDDNGDGKWDAKIAETHILNQFTFQRLTDLYGDIMYSEAGLGYEEGIYYPSYDTQEDVYKGMVENLKENRDILLSTDASTFDSDEDIIFGHLTEDERKAAWARTANSLLLRIGMRASSANPEWAQEVVEEAAAHKAGYIESFSTSESAMVTHSSVGGSWGAHENGTGSAINGKVGGFAYAHPGDEYLRLAQQNKDPRLFYAVAQTIFKDGGYEPWTGQTKYNPFEEAARPGEAWKPVSLTPARGGCDESYSVRGMKRINGNRIFCDYYIEDSRLNNDTISFLSKDDSGTVVDSLGLLYDNEWAQYHTLAAINTQTIGSQIAPTIVFGADETYFILAEAAAKGWNVPGDATTNLEKALSLAINKYPDLYPSDGSPETFMAKYQETTGDDSSFDEMAQAYIAKIIADGVTEEAIQTERWKSQLINGYEAFAIWNRTEISVTSTGIPYEATIDLPNYTTEDLTDADGNINYQFGVAVDNDNFTSEPFHNGGDTGGVRPRRMNYPTAELTDNANNIKVAMDRQEAENGNAGTHFISTKMWIGK